MYHVTPPFHKTCVCEGGGNMKALLMIKEIQLEGICKALLMIKEIQLIKKL
jgi:hypothetical protein